MTETLTNTRVTVEDGWAVRNLDDGSQVRARLLVDTMGDTSSPSGTAPASCWSVSVTATAAWPWTSTTG